MGITHDENVNFGNTNGKDEIQLPKRYILAYELVEYSDTSTRGFKKDFKRFKKYCPKHYVLAIIVDKTL